MRILVVSAPLLGHLFPLVPLARALRAAGHEVLVAAGGDAPETGLPMRDVAPGFRMGPIAARTVLRHPLIARAELAGRAGTRGVALVFGAVNARLAGPVVALARDWRPDLVIHEPLAVAGGLAAQALGIPAVLQENSLYDGRELVDAVSADLGWRLPEPALTLTMRPPSITRRRVGVPLRYVPYSGGGAVPDWLREPATRVLVSRSTVSGPGGGSLMKAVAAVASEVDAEFVFVRPDRAVAGPNIRTVGWMPLTEVLPTATAIVHHGGAGTVFAALAAGVPQLAVSGPGDRTTNGRLVADRGAGLTMPAKELTAAALRTLVSDATMRTAAAEVSREIDAMPTPAEVVPQVEAVG